jgi:hypothetical protein
MVSARTGLAANKKEENNKTKKDGWSSTEYGYQWVDRRGH